MEKKNKGLIVIVVLLVICLLLLSGYVIYDKVIKKEEKPSSSANNSEVKKEEKQDEEIELTDANIKQEVDEKINILLTADNEGYDDKIITDYNLECFHLDSKYTFLESFYNNNFNSDDFSFNDDYKLSVVLLYNLRETDNFKYLSDIKLSEKEIQSIKKYQKLEDDNDDVYISLGDNLRLASSKLIDDSYYNIFGTNAKNKSIDICPSFVYYEDINMYGADNCGGLTGVSLVSFYYKDSYTMKGDNVYVYLYAATYDNENDKIYKGFQINEKNYLYDINIDSEQKFKDNVEQNYQKFAKYRMVFEKDDDSLYKFKNIEKVD